jgi:glutamyl-tRNA synthetase
MNGVYIRQLPLDELTRRTLPYLERSEAEGGLPDSIRRPLDFEFTARVLSLEQERLKTLGEAAHAVSFFYTDDVKYDTPLLIQKGMDAAATRDALIQARDLLMTLEPWEHSVIEPPMRELAATLGLKPGQLFGSIRVAVSGRTATPPLFQMMEVLGRERTMARIEQAIERLS